MALVLTRNPQTSIQIGNNIRVINQGDYKVKLAVDAPAFIPIWRSEIYEQMLYKGLLTPADLDIADPLTQLDQYIQYLQLTASDGPWRYGIEHAKKGTCITVWRADNVWLSHESYSTQDAAQYVLETLTRA